jgi:hypothetical protein
MNGKVLASLLVVVCAAGALQAANDQSLTYPVQGNIGYTFMSDYMWHGINATKVFGGHSGTGAHEWWVNLGIDLKDLNPDYYGIVRVNFDQVYFSQYADTDGHQAKDDYSVSYTLPNVLEGDWTATYRYYNWLNLNGVSGTKQSQELDFKYAYYDGSLWQAITGSDWGKQVIYPTIEYIYDWEMAEKGGLLIGSISHPFQLEDIAPELTGLSLTPGASLAYDMDYYGNYFNSLVGANFFEEHKQMAYADYTLNLGADISKMAGIKAGKLTANAGIGFLNGFAKLAPADTLKDTLYSYFNVGFGW